MLDISKLKKVNPNDPNIKLIVPKNKGIYFWYENATDNVFYIGTGSGETGLYRRIVLQHLNPKQIEYRAKVHHVEKDAFQLEHPVIRERDGAPGVDQSVFRRGIGRKYNIKPGEGTVDYIKKNLYLKFFEVDDKEELMILEKQLILKHSPLLNDKHNKYKISNKLYE
jgi:hypothetical protein